MNSKNLPIGVLSILFPLIIVGCSGSSTSAGDDPEPEGPVRPGWTLVWSDEFDGPEIDLSKWEHEVNADGGGNNEEQYYTARPENSTIEDGCLVIMARRENYGEGGNLREFTSARLRTLNKGDWLYGRFEIRAKLPRGQGMWPAIWMLPTDWYYGGWPHSGEIDIMEAVNLAPDNNRVYGTIHYYHSAWGNNDHPSMGGNTTSGDLFSEEFHEFSLEWDPEEFRWYVDDQLYFTASSWESTVAPFPAPFTRRFHLILNVAVGGSWPGPPDLQSTPFPQSMDVDYVRVWMKD